MREVGPTQAFELGIEIRKVAALQQWVIAEVDAWHDILGAEGDLFGFGEKVVDTSIEHQPAHFAYWKQFFRNEFGGVEHVEGEICRRNFRQTAATRVPIPGN